MIDHDVNLTSADTSKLQDLLREAYTSDLRYAPYLQSLSDKLKQAVIVDPEEIPPDIVTMNSICDMIDMKSHEKMRYSLTFPETACAPEGRISILAPLGAAMLGAHIGTEVQLETPEGTRSIKILDISYQPEASGEYS